MQERNAIVHRIEASRGATLIASSTDATMPTHTTMLRARSPADSHNRVGAIQYRLLPGTASRTACKYDVAGRMPRSPIKPWIWKSSE